MSSPVADNKIFKPFMPSLVHLSLVQVSLPLYYEYETEMLSRVLRSIQYENYTIPKADIYGNPEGSYKDAKKKLLFIPEHLRERVVATVYGLEDQFKEWQYHFFFIRGMGESSFSLYKDFSLFKDFLCWRSDGTLDPIKTAKELVLNEKFPIRSRFQIACVHGLVNNVQEIWAEMEESGIADKDCWNSSQVEKFWIKWIRDGSSVHWIDALLEESYIPVRFIAFFPLLQPVPRQKFIKHLTRKGSLLANLKDDIRQCLNALSLEEETEMMRINAKDAILSVLNWPFNTSFVEIARKMVNFLSFTDTSVALFSVYSDRFRKDNDFREMFEEFYCMCPDNFKVEWREMRHFAHMIDKFFEEKVLFG